MSQEIKQINKPKLLIGEGKDEIRFFQSFLKYLNICDMMVESYNGKDNLYSYLKTLVLRPNFSQLVSIGITRDADNKPIEDLFKSICSALKRANLSNPNNLSKSSKGTPKINIFILPDNQNSGMLETLCLKSLKNDISMNCVDKYFDCIRQKSDIFPKNIDKAKIHAWLASREIPDKRLAEASEVGYFDFNNSAFDNLKEFIISL
ncbi:DUF3226 domain-containing protein [Cyanobacterium aponinum UTEX 3222]|uniref:Uncharacterized protein n=1 Tax=Cyanobacterium aponinum (strain PCC 10605) TaxID=755178 RepID=K9Z4R6_CYAAP|nr:DUF3226 domain-containing protein [Cyanobacterium aponinum]AFZ53707.1 hypothetical protein Cyan10605_1599 [Cyanobacterium aponinum PCC 10605]WRL41393.1 DUF3226 domain-containing protein [Cyanobacterium aponinum UTEX 3222]